VYDEFCPAAARGGGGAGVISLSLSIYLLEESSF
jgi:hypothetical protein